MVTIYGRSQGPRTPLGSGMASGSPVSQSQSLAAIPGASVYTVGRPVPRPLSGLAAIFGGQTSGPRATTPWQAGPRSFVGQSGAPDSITHLGDQGFVPGAHVWGPRPQDDGFPHGEAWPGYPDSWDTPYFTKSDDQGTSTLTKRISTVWSCVDLISRQLSSLPTVITKDAEPQPPKAWQVNPEPLLYSSWIDFAKCMINSLLMRGDAFLAVTARYADGYPARFVCLNPDLVHVEPEGDGQVTYWLGGVGQMRIDQDDLCHIKYQVWPGFPRGIAPLEAAWRNIASAEAMSGYSSAMSGRGGVPNAVLESDTTLTQEQAQGLKGSWRQMIASNGFEPVILTKGLHYKPLSLSARELALIDHRVFDEQRIASAYGVPLWLVGLPMADGLTYSTVEGTWDFFWRSNLRAFSHNMALAMSLWLLPADTYLRFIADELIRPQIKERYESYKIGLDGGWITVPEIRTAEGMMQLTPDQLAKHELDQEQSKITGKVEEGSPA